LLPESRLLEIALTGSRPTRPRIYQNGQGSSQFYFVWT
jgi:hypothetical protein